MVEHDNEDAKKGSITLSSFDIAKLTGGEWEGLNETISFSGVSAGGAEASVGELYIALDKEPWSASRLAALQASGARGVVVQREVKIALQALPLLRVDDPRDALRIMAEENARRAKARKILVTGTEGKTGLKIMLHHIICQQARCHAVLNSSNLHVPIWRSMASIHGEDEIAIIEVSVAQPNRGWQRSEIVRPHLCVITNISPQHTALHGSMDRLVRHKAEVVTALQPDGACIINADNEYFLDLKDAIQRIKPVPVMSFGASPFCEGQLISATFVPGKSGWQVQARIFGKSVNYFVRMVNSYAPLASVSALTVAAYLGLDLLQATASLCSFSPFETAGRIVKLPVKGGEFTLIDHSLRGSLAGFRSAFEDMYRVSGTRKALLVLGAILDLGEQEREPIHRQLAGLIKLERTKKIYTVGDEMRIVREAISDKSKLGPHGTTPEEIAEELLNDIQPGDVVFIKGHHRVWLSRLVEAMGARFKAGDERQIEPLSGITAPRADEPIGAAISAPEPGCTLIAGGDVMLSRDIPGYVASAGIGSPLREVRHLFARADIALVNLECVLSGRGDFFDKGEGRPFYYRCPPGMVDALVEAGISAVTTANNHAMDFGPEALADQSLILAKTGIAHAGSGANAELAMQPMYIRAGELIVAILSFATEQSRHAAGVNNWGIFQTGFGKGAVDQIRPAIDMARKSADLVIASPHWGENWLDQPAEEIRRLGWSLIDLGVDAVLGHSAHILQGVEVYRGKPIVYDMGSLLFDRVKESRMQNSALFELVFGHNGMERLVIHPVELESCSVRLANEEESARTIQLIEGLSRRLNPAVEFRVVGKTIELHLGPSDIARRKQDPEKIFDRRGIRRLKPGNDSINEANIFLAIPPAGIDLDSYIDLGSGLRVLGARFPEQGRAGFGFVLEVFFRCPDTRGRRWRASVKGVNPETGQEFRYRHPVAEGMWVPQNWHDEKIINDRIVVRPPENLAPGKYDLYWNLVDAGTGKLWKTETGHADIRDNWLFIGSIDFTRDAPRAVAGLSQAGFLPGRPIPE